MRNGCIAENWELGTGNRSRGVESRLGGAAVRNGADFGVVRTLTCKRLGVSYLERHSLGDPSGKQDRKPLCCPGRSSGSAVSNRNRRQQAGLVKRILAGPRMPCLKSASRMKIIPGDKFSRGVPGPWSVSASA